MLGLALDSSDGLRVASDHELLKSRLERLFFTPLNDQIGSVNSGSRILDYLWEGATEENARAILKEVKWLISAYEPNMMLTSVLVKFLPVSNSGAIALVIEISFYWIDLEDEEFNLNIIKIAE